MPNFSKHFISISISIETMTKKEEMENPKSKLWRDRNHSHFWIEDGELYESYRTIRGLRYMHRLSVPNLPDTENCPDDMLKYIEAEYL